MNRTRFARLVTSSAGVLLCLAAAPRAFPAVTTVLEYKFDEGSGGTAFDSSGNHNDAFLNSSAGAIYTTTAAQGPFAIHTQANGNGLSFVNPSANPFAGLTSFTVDAWVDPVGGSDRRSIISNTPGDGTGNGFNFYLNSPGTADNALVLETHGGTRLTSAASLGATGVYHNVAVAVSNAGANPTATLYVDFLPVAATGAVANITDLSTLPRIGVFTDGNFNSNFFGNIDDFRIFDAALTPAQVAALVPEPAPVALACACAATALLLHRRRNRPAAAA